MSENMWILKISTPGGVPEEYVLKVGRNTIGRKPDNDIVIPDVSASRLHAVIHYDEDTETIMIYDMGSTNGTYVNRERLTRPYRLESGDVIRIGGSVIYIAYRNTNEYTLGYMGTQELTRDLLLESLDQNAVLMYEISHQLNTVVDIDTALKKVASLMKQAMGADRGEVILAEDFDRISDHGFPVSIAKATIQKKTATVIPDLDTSELKKVSDSAILLRIRSAMCVPVLAGEEVIALIYMYKTKPDSRPFDKRDLELAVAISHQAALTIQRAKLIEQIKREQKIRQVFSRFLSPKEVDMVFGDYLKTGTLPPMKVRNVAVLIVDIQDSTTLAKELTPEVMSRIIDAFYKDVSEIIFKWGGVIKYQGDGVLAIFGMLERNSDRLEERAVRAGMEIVRKMEENTQRLKEKVVVGVGITFGRVVSGYVGVNEQAELNVFGDAVNIAHYLQTFARPNKVIVGEHIQKAVGNVVAFSSVENITRPDNTEQHLKAFQVLDILEDWNDEDSTVVVKSE